MMKLNNVQFIMVNFHKLSKTPPFLQEPWF